jgi:subtilase family serine protease
MALLAAGGQARAASVPSRVTLPSPNPADLAGTSKPLDPAQVLNLRVYLADRPGVAPLATAVSDPGSPGYGHYLTPHEFQRLFGPTAGQVAAVHDWLTGQGITVTASTAHYLAVTTTVGTFDKAFATQVSEYDTPRPFGGPYRRVALTGDLSVPAELGPDILSVTGFNETTLPRATGSADSPAVRTAPAARAVDAPVAPCSHYWAEHTVAIPEAYGQTTAPTPICGYTPQQIRHAYGVDTSPYTGKGATVAIILDDRNPDMPGDANRFFADHGLPGFAPGQYTEQDVSPPSSSHCSDSPARGPAHANGPGGLVGQWLESAIDIEAAHLAAPDAKLVYVGIDCVASSSGPGSDFLRNGLDGVTKVVDERLADVASGSWSLGEETYGPADLLAWDAILEQGAVEGIGFDFSSGDNGDALTGNPVHVTFPADDPWATQVGGTSLALGADGSVVGDYSWGRHRTRVNAAGTGYEQAPPGDFFGGSGGGVSTHYAQPYYQKPAVPAALSTLDGIQRPGRVGPDISLDAGIEIQVGYTGSVTEGQYDEAAQGSGTSLSSPLLAGLEADVIQAAGHPLGFINPLLYSARTSGAIRDILPVDPAHPPVEFGAPEPQSSDNTTLFTEGEDGVLQAAPGYDDASGLGAPSTSFIAELGELSVDRRK